MANYDDCFIDNGIPICQPEHHSELWSAIFVSANTEMQLKPGANILLATVFRNRDCNRKAFRSKGYKGSLFFFIGQTLLQYDQSYVSDFFFCSVTLDQFVWDKKYPKELKASLVSFPLSFIFHGFPIYHPLCIVKLFCYDMCDN